MLNITRCTGSVKGSFSNPFPGAKCALADLRYFSTSALPSVVVIPMAEITSPSCDLYIPLGYVIRNYIIL